MILEQLSRYVFYPLWDWKDKSHKLAELAKLQNSQWLSSEVLQHRQMNKLIDLLCYANDHSAYYKKMSAKERIETVQLLREHYFKLNRLDFNENRKRLRRVCRIIKQT